MDELDERLLRELMGDARAPNSIIAKRLRVSEGTVRNRLSRLLKEGVITGFSADVSLREQFMALTLVKTCAQKRTPDIVARIKKIDGFGRAFEVSGEWDVVLVVSVPSPEDYNEFIEAVREVDGVESTQSLVVLRKS
ncbi:Lrp/AsnC family transcriptional regulator [Candidatus Micrarchaeota archaeon]|nr:Lrp/AsnC family transcriptional regulator [Candidatus Micrarchaeota archaeon]